MSDEQCSTCGYMRNEQTTCRCGKLKSPSSLAEPSGSACLWLCTNPSISDNDQPKPDSDEFASKVSSGKPITAETAAEIAVETSDRELNDGDELAVWVWKPGKVAGAIEYFVRVSWSWNFIARPNDKIRRVADNPAPPNL